MIAWGVLSGLTAFTKSFFSLALLRFLLGFVEAPFFPGALFLLSTWYTKRELALRTSILYSGSLLSGAFGGIIAASVEATLGNFLGISSWRWLFLLESSCTILLAVSAMFILPDYPHTTRWLSAEDRSLAISRVRSQPGYHANSQRQVGLLSGLKMAVKDYKVWLLSLIIITKTSAGAVTSFIPTLVATFGFGRITTLLMVAPPYVIAAAASLFVGKMSDAKGQRASMVIATMTIAAIGFGAAALVVGEVWRYLCLFVMLGGVYGGYNVSLAWIASTVRIHLKVRISLTNTASLTTRKAISCDCNHQHDGQRCADILAILLPPSKWTKISRRHGRQHGVLSHVCWSRHFLATMSLQGEPLVGED
jgi:MFS family permease